MLLTKKLGETKNSFYIYTEINILRLSAGSHQKPTTMKKINIYKCMFGIALAFSVAGCKQEEAKEEEVKDPISVETDVKLDIVMSDIPSPMELTTDITKSGASINKSVMNPTTKTSSYTTNSKQALNLGVYFADLGYVAGYNQIQDANNYLATVKQLADNMGVGNAFDKEFYDRFAKHLGNNDSMIVVMDDGYKNAKKYLQSNDRVGIACQILAGGWVEGLYIATQIVGTTPKDATNALIYQRIGEQKYSLKNLFDLFEQLKMNTEVNNLMTMLQDIQNGFSNISPGNVSNAQVVMLGEKITALRNQIAN